MIIDEQHEANAFLSSPDSHGGTGEAEVVETHISRIFLAGERVWKMKRAVKLPYVDFSTPQLRLAACEKEVELNSLTAPGLYIAARRITREGNDRIVFDGKGELIDAAVEMRRFDQSCLLDRMAMAGELTPALMSQTALAIESFHRKAPVARSAGGTANMAAVLDINEAGFAQSDVFKQQELETFHAAMRQGLERHAARLDRRARAGRVRRCHGDLHLRNICVLDGEPQLFDCIEFNDEIATVDVLYDLAFLLMDLWHRGMADLANLVMNRYLDAADEDDGFPLLPFFMAVRAAVRAHVMATQTAEGDADRETLDAARAYFRLARDLLDEVPARLVVIGGLSGTGKTTVAEALAAHIGGPPGARLVESDRVRKAMHGVSPETRLPQKAYRPDVSDRVYGAMARRTGLILAEGGSVVADAVYERADHRAMIEKAGKESAAPTNAFWLSADPDILRRRVAARKGGPSDATVDILAHQLDRKIDGGQWTTLDAGRPAAKIVADILDVVTDQPDT